MPYDPESKGGSESTVKVAKRDLVPTDANLLDDYANFAALVRACDELAETNGLSEWHRLRVVNCAGTGSAGRSPDHENGSLIRRSGHSAKCMNKNSHRVDVTDLGAGRRLPEPSTAALELSGCEGGTGDRETIGSAQQRRHCDAGRRRTVSGTCAPAGQMRHSLERAYWVPPLGGSQLPPTRFCNNGPMEPLE